MENLQSVLRNIPSMDEILKRVQDQDQLRVYDKEILKKVLHSCIDSIRSQYRNGRKTGVSVEEILEKTQFLMRQLSNTQRTVVNATGIVIHTNLGRAPLSDRAQKAVNKIMGAYSNLEYDLITGTRGTRYQHIVKQLCLLTHAEDAIVVNNNAGAVLLVLSALAKQKEVIISRGQLVEIGGHFRIPDVLVQSGAVLAEVGTTNKTSLEDYERRICENTAAIMQIHTSNYRIIGFASQPNSEELTRLAHENNILMIANLGGGFLVDFPGNLDEPVVKNIVDTGADIVTFSGDKLLGACQAGIIVGKRVYIEQIKKHPLIRALRIDKLCLAALAGTLEDYFYSPIETIPVLAMLTKSMSELKEQAVFLASQLQGLAAGWSVQVEPLDSFGGGGTLPGVAFPSYGISIVAKQSAAWLERKLRQREIPIIVRIQGDKVIIDMRCLTPKDIKLVQAACRQLAQEDDE